MNWTGVRPIVAVFLFLATLLFKLEFKADVARSPVSMSIATRERVALATRAQVCLPPLAADALVVLQIEVDDRLDLVMIFATAPADLLCWALAFSTPALNLLFALTTDPVPSGASLLPASRVPVTMLF